MWISLLTTSLCELYIEFVSTHSCKKHYTQMTCSTIPSASCSTAPTKLAMDTSALNTKRVSSSSLKISSHKSLPINNDMALQQSDFSIDHILNRAGKWLETRNQQDQDQQYSKPFADGISLFPDQISDSQSLPIYNWLQYTRYRPPRSQSMYSAFYHNIVPKTHPRNMQTENSHHKPAKRTPGRLPRVPFSTHQLSILEDAYKQSSYLSAEEANRLADTLELTSTRVKIWFQNRRARERRERREADLNTGTSSDALPALPEVSSSTSVSPVCSSGSDSFPAILSYHHNYLDLCTQTCSSQRRRPF